jgi:hypothetical protein
MLRADLNTGKTAYDMLLSLVVQHDFVGFSLTCGMAKKRLSGLRCALLVLARVCANFGMGLG